MARLIVEAESEDGIAAPGNRQPNYILVSVTDGIGSPVTDLSVKNFKVQALIVGAFGAEVQISQVANAYYPGFYRIDIIPVQNYTWKSGVYIFAIVVEKGTNKGQTLARVRMD